MCVVKSDPVGWFGALVHRSNLGFVQKSDCIAARLPTPLFPHPAALTQQIIAVRAKIEVKQTVLK